MMTKAAEEKQPEKTEGGKVGTIFVRSTLPTEKDGGSRVALYDAHSDHPEGEAFVAGSKPVEVAKTPEVLRAMSEGRIEQVSKSEAKSESGK
jgi:hypothetical protein